MTAAVTTYRIDPPEGLARLGLRVALFADLHACSPFMEVERVAALVDQTNALDADLILLLGDYVGHVWFATEAQPEPVSRALAQLRAPLGVYGVFGNHDWRDDPAARDAGEPTVWHKAFADVGLRMLWNEALTLEAPGGPFTLAGLESQMAFRTFWKRRAPGHDDLPGLLPQLDPDRYTLLMAHEPDIFPDLPDHMTLTVCGHTHGGQILPFGKPLVVPSRYGARYAYGHFREGAKQMVVSGGLGFSGPPLRLGRPPELVLLEL